MEQQTKLGIAEPVNSVETYEFESIQGEPMLRWKGKRPFESTQFYPAQCKEKHGDEVDGWRNKIYWGDNLQVMSHLLKSFRGQVNLIYIDPPFDSKADYKKTVKLRGKEVENDRTAFEEKQYTDIWTNDEYLQFMYERLILLRELLADDGTIYVHCDWHQSHYLRCILDDVFGRNLFVNEIIWQKIRSSKGQANSFGNVHDTVYMYAKNPNYLYNKQYTPHDPKRLKTHYNLIDEKTGQKYQLADFTQQGSGEPRRFGDKGLIAPPAGKHWIWSQERIDDGLKNGLIVFTQSGKPRVKRFLDESKGQPVEDIWTDIFPINSQAKESVDYPTQKPEALLERIIRASSNPGDLIFDCFMGSGTTQAVAMKLGRRFIGADINLGAIETTSKRLVSIASEIQENMSQGKIDSQDKDSENPQTFYTGFEIYNVNHYDVFRNPVEAKDLLIEALQIQPLPTGGIYDGEKDGRKVKIMPINRIATRADLNELITGFNQQAFEKRQAENPNAPVEKLLLVCMGHEPDLAAALNSEVPFDLDIQVTDILRDKSELEFKREADAKIVRNNGQLVIEQFYPMNLLQKLSLMKENVEDWRELVESVKIDFNYDDEAMKPCVVDLPEGNELVKGSYPIPEDAGTIRVKITDLLSESLEGTLE